MKYHVLSLRPGMHRGGRANPQHAEYVGGDHTPEQFRDLLGDPNIVVILAGERMEAEHVGILEAEIKLQAAAMKMNAAEAKLAEPVKPAKKG